jgi:hypothetical protein
MPQYWLKPLGVSDPPDPMDNEWTVGADLASYPVSTGPKSKHPPQMGRRDRIIFHAVIHGRVFAEGEILDNPIPYRDPKYGTRWPWLYPCRVDLWVPTIDQGPMTSAVAPKKAIGRIQAGGDFARLSRDEYETIVNALDAVPGAIRR